MHCASVSGVVANNIELILRGTSFGVQFRLFMFVKLKSVALTTLTPFSKISAVVPFHLIAILDVLEVVVYKLVPVPPIYFRITTRWFALLPSKVNEFPNPFVNVERNNPAVEPSRITYGILFLNSTNQVPPSAVIKPLVYMLFRVIISALRVTLAVVVGM